MFTITKYGEKIPLVVLSGDLRDIKESHDSEIKNLIKPWLEIGFPVRSVGTSHFSSTKDNAREIDEEAVLEVTVDNLNAFQEFLQNTHALDIQGTTNP